MNNFFRDTLWKNFAAAIDMLHAIVFICPDDLWQDEKKLFFMVYHTVIFLDYYLTIPVKTFTPCLSYTISDAALLPAGAIDDVLPDKLYSKEELLAYISLAKEKCRQLIQNTPEAEFNTRWITDDEMQLHDLCPSLVAHYSLLEILFYNLRHVQHHVGQLNILLRQKAGVAVDWIAQAT
jgi:hypothetical protein